MHEAALAAEAVYWNMQKASQSLRPQAQRKFRAFFPMTCASEKILLGSQTCERKRVRCGEPLSPLKQTPQRSGVCLNQQKAERRNAVPLLASDSQPGERRPRAGKPPERGEMRGKEIIGGIRLSCFVRLSVYYRKSAPFS